MSDITDAEKYDETSREVRLLHVASVPASAKGKKWRWDVVRHHIDAAGQRVHVSRDTGYTRTRLGALYQIGSRLDH